MAGNTTNFSIQYPTSTDLVKDGATAIQTVAQGFDTRLGNVATYPNQIVNVVSGISRPVAYATAAGVGSPVFTASTSGTVTITLPASRFTVAPLILLTNCSGSGNLIGSTYRGLSISTSSFQISGLAATAITQTGTVHYMAIQMTSTTQGG